MASSGRLYLYLQIATSSAPITDGGPIGGYRSLSTGGLSSAGGFATTTVKSGEVESIDLDGIICDLDLTLLPIEESGKRLDSVPITDKLKRLERRERKITCGEETGVKISREVFKTEETEIKEKQGKINGNPRHAAKEKRHALIRISRQHRTIHPVSRLCFKSGRRDPRDPCILSDLEILNLRSSQILSNRDLSILRGETPSHLSQSREPFLKSGKPDYQPYLLDMRVNYTTRLRLRPP
ncbi:hypothetical protein F2Q70_00030265 [Brassica cretica]|uniref:Uncharacterized protein n=1 Tax=Brassica cretica TaxID=69181 RepID=A0A8S9FE96_BRACR|nr:hypothetical protein F2Q70_00030265 [Brassica cretica]KAF2549783.1 hypothetical protein F2Q68_00034734 [Brassica cretica]